MSSSPEAMRVAWLYPEHLNIYADRGNLLLLERRCEWRGIEWKLDAIGIGDALDPEAYDVIYLGGGQDRDQARCAADLVATKRDAIHVAAEAGVAVLGICGGYQLLGHEYELGSERVPGVGLLDLRTVRGSTRLIGDVEITVDLPRVDGSTTGPVALAGFENHGGRTLLGAVEPLGTVVHGHGNDGESGVEGARRGSVLGTYLHGPLLPKNVWFADELIAAAVGTVPAELEQLDDRLEDLAHESARRAA
ncbi:MAG: glutamine amidotransferase, partial [Solirubrobacteraceae bacterium]|nr:glutamine amidotransferase [Solirubrobacteraceae bacterium]